MRIRPKIDDGNEGNIFWITMTDLMTGLVLVFIVMFFYTYMTSHMEMVKQNLAKESANKSLQESLISQDIKATIDPISGVVKISDLELFDLSSYKLSDKGKAYLDKFAPAYLNSLFSNEYLNNSQITPLVLQCPKCKGAMLPSFYSNKANGELNIDYYNNSMVTLANSKVWLLIHPTFDEKITLNLLKSALMVSNQVEEIYIIDKDINIRENYRKMIEDINSNIKVNIQNYALEDFLNSIN